MNGRGQNLHHLLTGSAFVPTDADAGRNAPGRVCSPMRTGSFRFRAFLRIVASALCLAVIAGHGQNTNAISMDEPTASEAAGGTNTSEAPATPEASRTKEARPLDYAAVKMLHERNIFNANRSARSGRDRRGDRRQTKVETFSLVGTMSYAKGDFAFFDGSNSGYR